MIFDRKLYREEEKFH